MSSTQVKEYLGDYEPRYSDKVEDFFKDWPSLAVAGLEHNYCIEQAGLKLRRDLPASAN